MIQLAFYKGKGDFFDKLIRWWTKSPYSHVALVDNGICYEADANTGKVIRWKWLTRYIPENWDLIEVDSKNAATFMATQVGKGYDYLGILGFILPWKPQVKSKWYCSELVAAALGMSKTSISPGTLFNILKEKQA